MRQPRRRRGASVAARSTLAGCRRSAVAKALDERADLSPAPVRSWHVHDAYSLALDAYASMAIALVGRPFR